MFEIELFLILNCILLLNWIIWNRSVYMYKNERPSYMYLYIHICIYYILYLLLVFYLSSCTYIDMLYPISEYITRNKVFSLKKKRKKNKNSNIASVKVTNVPGYPLIFFYLFLFFYSCLDFLKIFFYSFCISKEGKISKTMYQCFFLFFFVFLMVIYIAFLITCKHGWYMIQENDRKNYSSSYHKHLKKKEKVLLYFYILDYCRHLINIIFPSLISSVFLNLSLCFSLSHPTLMHLLFTFLLILFFSLFSLFFFLFLLFFFFLNFSV